MRGTCHFIIETMKKDPNLITTLILITLLSGCYVEPQFVPEFPVGEVEGYRPLYASLDQATIAFTTPRHLLNPGKIYVVSTYLLINEKYEGIHVFDNTDPSNPVPLGFLRMAGNTEIAVKDNVLYADHLTDLVALNVENWNDIRELSRLKQEHWHQDLPPGDRRYFACVDPSKGVVIGWELTVLKEPRCFH